MKQLTALITFIALCTFTISCQEPENEPGPTDFGYLSMSITLTVTSEEANGRLDAVNTDDFRVTIFEAGGTEVIVFDPYSSAPSEVALPSGEYYVEAHSNNLVDAAFDNPYYFGRSANFTIDKEETTTIDIEPELANTKVAILYSENVENTFDAYTGTAEVIATGATLFYAQGETREGYFVTSPLEIVVDLSYTKLDGTTIDKSFTTTIDDPQPKTLYNINVDATLVDGVIGFNITVDETFDVVDIDLGLTVVEGCLLTQYAIVEDTDEEIWDIGYTGADLNSIEYDDNYGGDEYTTSFIYDGNGNITEVNFSGNSVGKEEFTYDGGNQLVERIRYRDYGSGLEFNAREVYSYNSFGQIIRIDQFREDGGGSEYLDYWITFQYNNDTTWNPFKSEEYNQAGTNYRDRYYTYDDNPNPIRTSGLWICDDCIDFEEIPFTDNNITFKESRDGLESTTEGTLDAFFTYNTEGYPISVDYVYSNGDTSTQTYMYTCN